MSRARRPSGVEERLQDLVEIDFRAGVWATARCLRAGLSAPDGGAPPSDRVPSFAPAVEALEAWSRGTIDATSLDEAVQAAARDPGSHGDRIGDALCGAIAHLAGAIADPDAQGARGCAAAVFLLGQGLARHEGTYTYGDCLRGTLAPLARLAPTVEAQRWPRRRPDPAQIEATPRAVQIAWDAVHHADGDHTIAELFAAHARAERLGLDWVDPVQRAVAERTTDEGQIAAILQSGRRDLDGNLDSGKLNLNEK